MTFDLSEAVAILGAWKAAGRVTAAPSRFAPPKPKQYDPEASRARYRRLKQRRALLGLTVKGEPRKRTSTHFESGASKDHTNYVRRWREQKKREFLNLCKNV